MKLYAKIQDRESFHCERVVLCQFKDSNNDEVFVEEVEHYNLTCFKVLVDEGYVKTEYYYPVNNFSITELAIYE